MKQRLLRCADAAGGGGRGEREERGVMDWAKVPVRAHPCVPLTWEGVG